MLGRFEANDTSVSEEFWRLVTLTDMAPQVNDAPGAESLFMRDWRDRGAWLVTVARRAGGEVGSMAELSVFIERARARLTQERDRETAWCRPRPARDAGGAPLFTREATDLLVRLSGLFVTVNRLLVALGAGLTSEQHDQTEAALDRAKKALLKGDELQACVDELENARRMLIGRHATLAPPALPARQTPTPAPESSSAPSDRRSDDAALLYGTLIRSRLAVVHCRGCRTTLASGLLIRTHTSVGLLLNEYQLGEMAAARLLACTDELVVECAECGARNDVPVPKGSTA